MDISFFIIPFKKNLQLDNVQIKYKKKNTYIYMLVLNTINDKNANF